MITFGPFRSKRLTVELRELTIGQAMELCARPPHLHESAISAMLRHVVIKPEGVAYGQVTDTRLWTVQERGAVAAHYLAHVSGMADFAIGDKATYSDYLTADRQEVATIELGDIGGDQWTLHPLLGFQAEAIERVIDMERMVGKRNGWMIGAMAFQMLRGEAAEAEFSAECKLPAIPLQDLNDFELDEWLVHRVETLKGLPESVFAQMLSQYLYGNDQAQHLLRMAFADDGIVFVAARDEEGKEVPGLPSARFPVSDMLSPGTAQFLGFVASQADESDAVQQPAARRGDGDDAE